MLKILAAPSNYVDLSTNELRDFASIKKVLEGTNNVTKTIKVHGHIDTSLVKLALQDLIERHDGLRTRFVQSDGKWIRELIDAQSDGFFASVLVESEGPEDDARAQISDFIAEGFAMGTKALFRIFIYRAKEGTSYFCASIAHLISDGVSVNVFFSDFSDFYQARAQGSISPMLQKPLISMADFAYSEARWLESDDYKSTIAALSSIHGESLHDINSVANTLGIKKLATRPCFLHHAGFDDDMTNQIKAASKTLRVSPFAFLTALGGLAISRVYGIERAVHSVQCARRQFADGDQILGHFNGPMRLLFDATNSPSLSAFVKTIAKDWFMVLAKFSMIPITSFDDAIMHPDQRRARPIAGRFNSAAVNFMPESPNDLRFCGLNAAPHRFSGRGFAGNISQIYLKMVGNNIKFTITSTESEDDLNRVTETFENLILATIHEVRMNSSFSPENVLS